MESMMRFLSLTTILFSFSSNHELMTTFFCYFPDKSGLHLLGGLLQSCSSLPLYSHLLHPRKSPMLIPHRLMPWFRSVLYHLPCLVYWIFFKAKCPSSSTCQFPLLPPQWCFLGPQGDISFSLNLQHVCWSFT